MRAFLFLGYLIGATGVGAYAEVKRDIVWTKSDVCYAPLGEKQNCIRRFNCFDGSQYEIVYRRNRFEENGDTQLVAFCKVEQLSRGLDSCPQTNEVSACRSEAVQKNIILNQDRLPVTPARPIDHRAEAESDGATS